MNLVLDWGNTRKKIAVFDGSELLFSEVLQKVDEKHLLKLIDSYKPTNTIISSVVEVPNWLNRFINTLNGIYLSSKTKLPITNAYKTPQTLGNDRLANAVASNAIYPNNNTLSIDFGTCIKYDFIDGQARYKGGSISPGYSMRFKSLNYFTDKLPLVKHADISELTGDTTHNSILSGVFFGIISEVDGIINQYSSRFNHLNVIITGGDAIYFEKALKNPIFAHSFLTLYGLNEILLYNAK